MRHSLLVLLLGGLLAAGCAAPQQSEYERNPADTQIIPGAIECSPNPCNTQV